MSHLFPNNQSNASILSVVSGIDLKTTGLTTLYTVPTGKSCIITGIYLLVTSASGFVVAASARVGIAAAYTEYIPITALAGLATTNQFVNLATASALLISTKFAAADVVKLDVTTGATATTLTVTAYVFGFLI